jgi:5'-nucleotidase
MPAPNLKNLTILHSNDLHGDFLAREVDKDLLGGISMLSGYVSKVREETPNVLYVIAGDMLQGSIIDSEYMGLSTIEVMNLLSPDVVTVGNHEIDYGLSHLLFLERCAKFPIVNANLYRKNPYTRLFNSHIEIDIDGMRLMFIGITTEDILMGIKNDVLGTFVDIEDAAREVGKICNAHRDIDVDYTVLLTHIGFEEDKRLAELLDPHWGIDLIVGGHSHTILEEPEEVNGILVVQAGVGTKQIGRLDLVVDTDTNTHDSYEWELISITEKDCPRDTSMEETITRLKGETDQKYERLLCHFDHELTHPDRYQETELGNLLTDLLQDALKSDIVMLGSGSIRKQSVPTVFTLKDLRELFPYDDKAKQIEVTGAQFKKMIRYMMRDEMFNSDHTEFYQFSQGVRIAWDRAKKDFAEFKLHGEDIVDEKIYTIGLQEFHFMNFTDCFGFDPEEVFANAKPRTLSMSIFDILVEDLSEIGSTHAEVEGRIEVLGEQKPPYVH